MAQEKNANTRKSAHLEDLMRKNFTRRILNKNAGHGDIGMEASDSQTLV